MKYSKLALFASGFFFGGAVDHVILALMDSNVTPYGIHSGIIGNWLLASLDAGLTIFLYILYRHLEKNSSFHL